MKKALLISVAAVITSVPAYAIRADDASRIGTGLYGAVFAAYANNTLKFNKEVIPASGFTSKTFGTLDGGVGLGYMKSFDGFLVGGEAEAGLSNFSKTDETKDKSRQIEYKRNIFGNAIVKLGMKFDRAGVYVLGGFTRSMFIITVKNRTGGAVGKSNKAYQGPILGAGLMYNLVDKLSVRGEYKFIPFNTANLPLRAGLSVRATTHSFQFGMVYHV